MHYSLDTHDNYRYIVEFLNMLLRNKKMLFISGILRTYLLGCSSSFAP